MTLSKLLAGAFLSLTLGLPVTICNADPSPQQNRSVATVSLTDLAANLRQELIDGSIRAAHLHALQLEMAISGALSQDTASKIEQISTQSETDRDPGLCKRLVPWADQLIQALNEGDTANAKSLARKLSTEMHEVHKAALRQRIATAAKSNATPVDTYISLSGQLFDLLKQGDVARAEVLATQIQTLQDTLPPQIKRLATYAENIYNINDALGRSAFKRKDYLTAGDYLLKAAETPGSGLLSTFGPDLWLAQSLLDVGQRDVVLTFLQRCKNFWPSPKLDKWITEAQNGQTPDLHSNVNSTSAFPKSEPH
jgi:hypothetical protein